MPLFALLKHEQLRQQLTGRLLPVWVAAWPEPLPCKSESARHRDFPPPSRNRIINVYLLSLLN